MRPNDSGRARLLSIRVAPETAALGVAAAFRRMVARLFRCPAGLLCWLALWLLLSGNVYATAAEPKRVLIVHSFGSVAPPFTTHSTAFETELVKKMGNRVDLDEVSLDMARYAAPDMQEALVDYLEKRRAKWRPDLVVPIGGPAGIFVAQYRQRLFPGIPVLYCSLDRRLLGPDAFDKNTAFIGANYEVAGFVEDILQIAPDTKNIAVVIGATPLEQYWAETFRKGFEPFTNRLNFIWFNDLSFDQMLERTSKLPPKSFIFLVLLLRDAAGVTQNADEALQRLHAVANAPINSIFTSQMGLGIVGGRLYPSTEDGMQAADTAVRILNGESPSSFPPKIVPPLSPRYDWRELQHWKISEQRLPPGSMVLFQEPTAWKQYRGWLIAGISIFVIQALLISGLLANLIKRWRAERSLTESEQRFRRMADAAPVLIWMAGPDKLCTFFNKAWRDFTGRTMEQELGNGWAEGVYADDLGKCLKTYVSAFEAREPFVMQYRLRHHDGEYRWITDNGVPRYGADGSFRGYVGACADITDFLKQERALREFEERVALAAEAARLGVWELDTTTNQVWLSDKARDLFHVDGKRSISYASFQERVHPEDRGMRDAAVTRAIREEGSYEIEYRALFPDGTMRWMAGRGRCAADDNGKPTRLLGVTMDVTERKQAEEKLAQLRQRNELISNSAAEGILGLDMQGNHTFVNAAAAKMLGYEPEELLGRHSHSLWHHTKADGSPYPIEECNIYAAYRDAKVHTSATEVFWRKDGTSFPVEYSSKPVVDRGQTVGAVVTFMDISERKQAEEEGRRRREQIELLSRVSLLGEMTGSLAHELNQPLTALLTNANAGMRFIDAGNATSEQVREILVDIAADGRRAHQIIDGVRNAIKKGGAIRGPVNLNDVVRMVTHMVEPDAAAHSCEIETSLAETLPAIEGDPVQIQQVLINLVSNAFEAMCETPPGRRRVQITTEHDGDSMVRVAVRDFGPGLPAKTRGRLFEHFYTTKEEGLGMGLAIVRSIVEAHGGKIAVENVDGGGARFYFNLPSINGETT